MGGGGGGDDKLTRIENRFLTGKCTKYSIMANFLMLPWRLAHLKLDIYTCSFGAIPEGPFGQPLHYSTLSSDQTLLSGITYPHLSNITRSLVMVTVTYLHSPKTRDQMNHAFRIFQS